MKVELAGINETIEMLTGIPPAILRKGVSAGARAIGNEGAKDLRKAVPVRTGKTRRAVGSRLLKKRGDELAALKIGESRSLRRATDNRHVLRFLEKGTKRHILWAWDSNNNRLSTQAIRRMNKSGATAARAIYHPGFRGRYLLRQLIATNNKKYAQKFENALLSKVGQL